jgi:hypothetical protein
MQLQNSLVHANFSITMWYPRLNQTNEPSWANCMYAAAVLPSGQSTPGGPGFAFCVPVGSSAFVVTEEGFYPV